MAGSVERRGEYIKQLSFDTLPPVSPDDAQTLQELTPTRIPEKSNGAVRRSVPPRRRAKRPSTSTEGIRQHTFDEIFATIPEGVDIPLFKPQRERSDKNERPLTQLTFYALVALPIGDAATVQKREPAGGRKRGGSDRESITTCLEVEESFWVAYWA